MSEGPKYHWPGVNQSSPDHPLAVRISNGTSFDSMQISGTGAFGDVVTAKLSARVQHDFVYGGNELHFNEDTAGAGAVTYAEGMAKCQSNGTGLATLMTKRVNKYRSGQGALFRFTAIFSEPAADSQHIVGAFSSTTDALAVGYGKQAVPEFGFLRRHGGAAEAQIVQITTPSGGAEALTITLDGTGHSVSVTAGTVQETAQEIAEGTYTGWVVEAIGDKVHFLSDLSGVRGGAYSLANGGGATVGSFSSEVTGVAVTDEWHYKSTWNIDKLDGSGASGMTILPDKLNVFAISLQYLGAGPIVLYVKDGVAGRYIPVHRIGYANENTVPSMANPTFHLGLSVDGDADVWCKSASVAGFIEGDVVYLSSPHTASFEGAVASAVPIISVRNSLIFHSGGSRTNLRDLFLDHISSAATGSNKPVKATIVKNGTLVDPLWEAYNNGNSIAHVDKSASSISGGEIIFAFGLGPSTPPIQFADDKYTLAPGDIYSLVCEPSGQPADIVASVGWREDL